MLFSCFMSKTINFYEYFDRIRVICTISHFYIIIKNLNNFIDELLINFIYVFSFWSQLTDQVISLYNVNVKDIWDDLWHHDYGLPQYGNFITPRVRELLYGFRAVVRTFVENISKDCPASCKTVLTGLFRQAAVHGFGQHESLSDVEAGWGWNVWKCHTRKNGEWRNGRYQKVSFFLKKQIVFHLQALKHSTHRDCGKVPL